ncbi:thioredoxin-domain-containing protein [Saccharata proteae CBS 121410]|uniref:protein disulfide-isomerase n=1 Tax=Saccharata proteae CBS 121410 TaxID=1314787 RepID=A0A9P4HPE0_9PEZI|nr:thioredoxin-domain-containing protein [Saccharata proteae CBS 121410]
MLPPKVLAALAASFLLTTPVAAEGIYSKSSPVLEVDAKTYPKLIANSNHTSIVEFYAPWCGHCRNLKPAYEKAAKNLDGLAKVAAMNCDDDANKPFCGSMGVKGFPTLKIVKPGKKPGRPIVEDYQGARTAKAIVDAVVDKIPNHVKRIGDKDIEDWLNTNKESPKAILFTEKGTTSALLRALAVDFLGSIEVAQVRSKEAKTVEKFNVEKFPTLVLLPGGAKEARVYTGELKKTQMTAFLMQAASPNPDPAPKAESSASASAKASVTEETLEDFSNPTESPDPNVVGDDTPKPVEIKDLPPAIKMLDTETALQNACLTSKSSNCILAFLPTRSDATEPLPDDARDAIASLGEIMRKHRKGGSKLFPFYSLPVDNEGAAQLRKALGLKDEGIELVLTSAKRGWWKHYDGSEYTQASVEDWVDAVRMGEGKKEKLPEGVVQEAKEQVEAIEEKTEEKAEQQPIKIEVEEIVEEVGHDEL